MAGNQLGKTLSAAAETAFHATGRYPDWWDGRTFDKPVHGWVSGVTGESTRDNPQRILYGPISAPGSGMIPADAIKDTGARRGITDALDSIIVRHGGGGDVQAGDSIVQFKSYDQGREKWQGPTLNFVWFDEEPPEEIYTEGLTRTNIDLCPVFTTFTPLLGITGVVKRFYPRATALEGTHLTQMTIEDVYHYTDEQRKAIIQSYPAHERAARAKGIPQLGSGRVFPVNEDDIRVPAFAIPEHFTQICGLDFGWDHPSAAVRLAIDRDNDVIYVVDVHRQREQTPTMFASSVKRWPGWIPYAWPHDGLQHDKGSGVQLAQQYRDQGLNLLPTQASFSDGSNGVEAGVSEMLDRMNTGRLQVFAHLAQWFEEFNVYHRKDGIIVKLGDDLLSATRYAIMMRRFACVEATKTSTAPRARTSSGIRNRADSWMGG